MGKKQTAIDSLIKRCNDSLDKEPINSTQQEIGYSIALLHIIILLEEAKEMEEKQIKDAWIDGFKSSAEGWNGEMLPYYKDGKQTIDEYKEEYYNETYGTC